MKKISLIISSLVISITSFSQIINEVTIIEALKEKSTHDITFVIDAITFMTNKILTIQEKRDYCQSALNKFVYGGIPVGKAKVIIRTRNSNGQIQYRHMRVLDFFEGLISGKLMRPKNIYATAVSSIDVDNVRLLGDREYISVGYIDQAFTIHSASDQLVGLGITRRTVPVQCYETDTKITITTGLLGGLYVDY